MHTKRLRKGLVCASHKLKSFKARQPPLHLLPTTAIGHSYRPLTCGGGSISTSPSHCSLVRPKGSSSSRISIS